MEESKLWIIRKLVHNLTDLCRARPKCVGDGHGRHSSPQVAEQEVYKQCMRHCDPGQPDKGGDKSSSASEQSGL